MIYLLSNILLSSQRCNSKFQDN